jgi:small-conductance mechanosensitive channel
MIDLLNNNLVIKNVIITLVLLFSFILLRMAISRSILGTDLSLEIKRKWVVNIKNASLVFFVLCLIFIWGSEIRTLAFSIVAVAAAVVIATKELILCFMGGVLNSITRPFKIGDRIEVADFRGDVINYEFFSTTLYEIGPGKTSHQYTGKCLFVPNSIFLNSIVSNETRTAEYNLHSFSVFIPYAADIEGHQTLLLSIATDICKKFIVEAKTYMHKIESIQGIEAPSTDPRVTLAFPTHDRIELIVRIPVPSLYSGKIEQRILQKYANLRKNVMSEYNIDANRN